MTGFEAIAVAIAQRHRLTDDSSGVELGIYEKALPSVGSDWDVFFESSVRAGYSFVDLSVDETADRFGRLSWSAAQRRQVLKAAERHKTRIGGLCLSAHRRIGLGSQSEEIREQALAALKAGIELCVDLAVPVLQIAGYFAFYEPPEAQNRNRYLSGLLTGTNYAARHGVLLGIENVDGPDLNSISSALDVVKTIASPWLQLYPDIGNLSEQQLDVVDELRRGQSHMLAIHVKDTRPGEPRRVPMGSGEVPWESAFDELARQRWSGRMLVEMWNDESAEAEQIAEAAGIFIKQKLAGAGIAVLAAPAAKP